MWKQQVSHISIICTIFTNIIGIKAIRVNKETTKKLKFLKECNKNLFEIKNELLNEIRKEIELNVQKNFLH